MTFHGLTFFNLTLKEENSEWEMKLLIHDVAYNTAPCGDRRDILEAVFVK